MTRSSQKWLPILHKLHGRIRIPEFPSLMSMLTLKALAAGAVHDLSRNGGWDPTTKLPESIRYQLSLKKEFASLLGEPVVEDIPIPVVGYSGTDWFRQEYSAAEGREAMFYY